MNPDDAEQIAAARAMLKLDFDQTHRDRMHRLELKSQNGLLTPDEEVELNQYQRGGRLFDTAHSKARLILKKFGLSE